MLKYKGEELPHKLFIYKNSLRISNLISLKRISDLEGLNSIPEIKELRINNCGLKDLDAFEYFPKLEKLEIHKTNLTDLRGLENLTLNHLKFIRLEKNKIDTFPEILLNVNNLEKLYLDENYLSSLPDSFAKLTKLWKLRLSYNKFSIFPDAITKLPSLKSLDISDNNLSKIPESIGNLTLLERLYMYDNPIKFLPNSIGKLINLKLLAPGKELETLPKSILNLPNLRDLRIKGCYKLDKNSKIVRNLILNEIKRRPRAVFAFLRDGYVQSENKIKILNLLFKALRHRENYEEFLKFFETPDLFTKRSKKDFVRNILINGDKTDMRLALNANLISCLSDKELIEIIIDNLLIVPQNVIEFTHYFTLNYLIDIFSKEYYKSVTALIQSSSRRKLLNSLDKEKLSNFIQSPKIDFFQIIVNTINYFERDIERQINNLKETDLRNQNINVEIQKLKFEEYEFIWGISESEGSDIYYFLEDIKKIAPKAFKKELIRKFEEDNPDIIHLILKMELFWDFSSEDIDILKKDVKKNIIKHLIRIWGNEEFFHSSSNFNDYMYDTFKDLLKGEDDTVKILYDQMISAFETGSSEQTYRIFLFAKNNCLEIFDLSSINTILGFMRLTEQSDTDNSEMYYTTDIREKLFKLGKEKGKSIFENVIQILKGNHLIDLKSLIKLRWLEILNIKQLEIILNDKEIKFLENIGYLIYKVLNNKGWEVLILEDYVGLLYKINLIEEGIHIAPIFEKLKGRIKDFISFLYALIKAEDYLYDKRIKYYAEKLRILLNNSFLK
ncbi:hypothetical protein LCGC14_0693570 [marine sediment metagenome]|uniref:Disease resistance R13L4/SHOC-2-like LRR domain-containing protein n=1 Tax=marine sediment metagenome TaxID=412755 RepID=A0A0F9QPQ9_9ZZZZ